MNAKSRRIRRNKRNCRMYFCDELLVYKKPRYKSKKMNQKSKIRVNYFYKKMKQYMIDHPESISEFTNTWTSENDN